MKLSEAILLASTMGEKPHNDGGWDCCLAGVACHAVGRTNLFNEVAPELWPWLTEPLRGLDGQFAYLEGYPARFLLTAMCTRISMEEASSVIASIEPRSEPEAIEGGDPVESEQRAEAINV